MSEPWYAWNWDYSNHQGDLKFSYSRIVRWRRGWVTLYKLIDTEGHVAWRLYLPFNICVGIQL